MRIHCILSRTQSSPHIVALFILSKQLDGNTLTTQRHNAVNRKGVLETNIDNYHTIIADNTASAAMHDEEAARFQELHDTWEVDCANK